MQDYYTPGWYNIAVMDEKIERLRLRFRDFIYEGYSFSYSGHDLNLQYIFRMGEDVTFHPNIAIKNIDEGILRNSDSSYTENFVFNIGMVILLSYWKLAASPKIIVKEAHLSNWQISWWTDLYLKGMSQYFFENSFDFTNKKMFTIISDSERNIRTKPVKVASDKIMIPVGGGKDSTVTLELLKNNFNVSNVFIMKPASEAAFDVVRTSEVKETIVAEHNLDPLMLQMNSEGFLNGHTPYSALLAFVGTFAAFLTGSKYILFSNERSSNEGNNIYNGTEINHQYSKTYEFENKFREYNNKVLSDIHYLSFLRPLYELQIAQLFSKMEKYFQIVKSCNKGQKEGIWCSNCAKCLSTYILLFPFLGLEQTSEMFGSDLFAKEELIPLLTSMVNENEVKPFECIGTREETKVALYLSMIRYGDSELPSLIQYAKDTLLAREKGMKSRSIKILTSWNDNNNLDDTLTLVLKTALRQKNGE